MEGFIKETLQGNTVHILLLCHVLLTQSPQTLHMVMINSENIVKEKLFEIYICLIFLWYNFQTPKRYKGFKGEDKTVIHYNTIKTPRK